MFCKHCGAKIDDDSTFCTSCGKSLSGGRFNNTSSGRDDKSGGSRQVIAPNMQPIIYIVLSIVCVAPIFYAEYRRLIEGMFDIWYWLLAAPSILAIFLIYKLISAPMLEAEKQNAQRAAARGEDYDESKLSNIKTNALSISCVIIAAIAFAASFIIQGIF